MRSRFAIAALVGVAIACGDSPTAPSPVLSSFQVVAGLSSGEPTPPTVRTSPGHLTIAAETKTPTPCYALAADFTPANAELRLDIEARPTSGACVQVIGSFFYNAVITVPPGNYTLVVVHRFPGTGWPTTEVLRQSVTVN